MLINLMITVSALGGWGLVLGIGTWGWRASESEKMKKGKKSELPLTGSVSASYYIKGDKKTFEIRERVTILILLHLANISCGISVRRQFKTAEVTI